jgi:hypothetical protein
VGDKIRKIRNIRSHLALQAQGRVDRHIRKIRNIRKAPASRAPRSRPHWLPPAAG